MIGYGNPLRGDDGIGPRIAVLVGRRRPDVRVLHVHQLTPELAPVVAGADVAVFVDARAGGTGIRVERLVAEAQVSAIDHAVAPGAVLAMAAALYGRRPAAWCVSVSVRRLEFADTLSPAAARAAEEAVAVVCQLLPLAAAAGGRAERHLDA